MNTYFKKFFALTFSFVFIFMTFVPCVAAADNKITEVNITVPVPQVGDEVPFFEAITVDNENCSISYISWFAGKDGIENVVKKPNVFEPDLEYTLFLFLYPDNKDGSYTFAEDCKVSLNGNPVEWKLSSSGNSISVEYNFGNPEPAIDSNTSFLETIKNFFEDIFTKISQFFKSIFEFKVF